MQNYTKTFRRANLNPHTPILKHILRLYNGERKSKGIEIRDLKLQEDNLWNARCFLLQSLIINRNC